MALRLDLIPPRWLEYEPPGLCHTGLEILGAIGTVASIGGTLVSMKSGMDQAEYQSAAARNEAIVMQQKANEDAAVGQRQMITRQRATDLAQSRAQALAANSGTDATSADILNTQAGIEQQGEYNALAALYEGQARSRADLYQSDIDLFKAKNIERAAPIAAAGTFLSGISSIAKSRQSSALFDMLGDRK